MRSRNSAFPGKRSSGFADKTNGICERISIKPVHMPSVFPLFTCLIGFILGLLLMFRISASPPSLPESELNRRGDAVEAPALHRRAEPPVRSRPRSQETGPSVQQRLRSLPQKDELWSGKNGKLKRTGASFQRATKPDTTSLKQNTFPRWPQRQSDETTRYRRDTHTTSSISKLGIPKQPSETEYQEVGDDVTFCDNRNLETLPMPPKEIKYMYDRFRNMYSGWKNGVKKLRDKSRRDGLQWSFSKLSPLTAQPSTESSDCSRKRILMFIGTFLIFKMDGLQGNPQGGLVQWTDLYAALVFLGYDVHVAREKDETRLWIPERWAQYDLVLTDYAGAYHLGLKQGTTADVPGIAQRCKFRILDTFGTQEEFNMAPAPKPATMFCCLNLDLRQYFTFIPDFAPENSFLGYAVPHKEVEERKRAWQGLIWAKSDKYFEGMTEYLEVINEYIPLVSTVQERQARNIPNFVRNKGLQSPQGIHELYEDTALLVGLGTPFNGPSGIEAVTHGTAVLNVKHNPPASSETHTAMEGKPTRLGLTSQHPFLENYVGKPWVYTVDPNNITEVRQAMKELKRLYFEETDSSKSLQTCEGYVPYSYSAMGFLERVHLLIEQQDLCT
eukprot:gb/GECG01000201.1/.p1 GENE.gb/GECG01000201.1/~~gb/GECG01000201.1/.p1  ORF type:complete len:614 (+),score=56.75 gb/GECG01000201.1/:1-1842(+)